LTISIILIYTHIHMLNKHPGEKEALFLLRWDYITLTKLLIGNKMQKLRVIVSCNILLFVKCGSKRYMND
jgi:hypothetical protein